MVEKILLIEDVPEYQDVAMEVLGKHGKVTLVKDYLEAKKKVMGLKKDTRVVSDCFFPYETGTNNVDEGRKLMQWLFENTPTFKRYDDQFKYIFRDYFDRKLSESEANQPFGYEVAKLCENKGLSFVLATSLNHHHFLGEPFAYFCKKNNWLMVEGPLKNSWRGKGQIPLEEIDNYRGEGYKKNMKESPRFWEGAMMRLNGEW